MKYYIFEQKSHFFIRKMRIAVINVPMNAKIYVKSNILRIFEHPCHVTYLNHVQKNIPISNKYKIMPCQQCTKICPFQQCTSQTINFGLPKCFKI